MPPDPIFITCAVTGSSPLPDHPGFPVSPAQIAEAGLQAAKAGAAILHLHVRDPDSGAMSTELAHYREVVERIRAVDTDVILNLTTGPGCTWMQSAQDPAQPGPGTLMFTAQRRLQHVLALKPDICSLDICTMNLWGGAAINLEPMITEMAGLIRAARVMPEIECFDAGDLVFAQHLIDRDVLDGPGLYAFVLGTQFGLPATPEAMLYARNQLPRRARWTGFGISRHAFPMAAQSLLLGGNVRVGFEDSLYLSRGLKARTNAELVTAAVELATRLGRPVAGAAETRAAGGLGR